jgi:hypothetical protein
MRLMIKILQRTIRTPGTDINTNTEILLKEANEIKHIIVDLKIGNYVEITCCYKLKLEDIVTTRKLSKKEKSM